MSDQPASVAAVREHLHQVSEMLRHVRHLGPEAQVLLADLMDELSKTLESTEVPSAEVARLTESASQLAQAVKEKKEPGVLEAARQRVDRAVLAVETEAPVLAGLTRRLAEMLSNVGI
jgi:hypothetical protein